MDAPEEIDMAIREISEWHTRVWTRPTGKQTWSCAMGGFVVAECWLSEEMQKVEYGPLFVYMYRRFGVPQRGSDCYKEIANWYLSTPDDAVALCVSPRPSGAFYSFGYAINLGVYSGPRSKEQIQAVNSALCIAANDLLCPVAVRDVYINALGIVPEDNLTFLDEDVQAVERSRWAGYGVPHLYFEERYGTEAGE